MIKLTRRVSGSFVVRNAVCFLFMRVWVRVLLCEILRAFSLWLNSDRNCIGERKYPHSKGVSSEDGCILVVEFDAFVRLLYYEEGLDYDSASQFLVLSF